MCMCVNVSVVTFVKAFGGGGLAFGAWHSSNQQSKAAKAANAASRSKRRRLPPTHSLLAGPRPPSDALALRQIRPYSTEN